MKNMAALEIPPQKKKTKQNKIREVHENDQNTTDSVTRSHRLCPFLLTQTYI